MSNTIRKTANTVLDKLAESAQQTAARDEKNAKRRNINVATLSKAFASSVLLSGLLGFLAVNFSDEIDNNATDKFISGYSYKYAKQHDMLWSFWANVVMVSVLLPVLIDRFSARGHATKSIQNDLSEYMAELANIRFSGLSLDEMDAFIRNSKNKRDPLRIEMAVLEVVNHLSRADRKYFDDFIANPTKVHSQELAASVMRAHLKMFPEDLEKLYNAFESQHLPPEIRRAYERLKKDYQTTISWDQVLEMQKANGQPGEETTPQEFLKDLIADYGYYQGFADPDQQVGRSSNTVEYMAVLPKAGKKAELLAAAAKMNVAMQETRKIMPGGQTPETVLVFQTKSQPVFKEMIREIVNDAKEK